MAPGNPHRLAEVPLSGQTYKRSEVIDEASGVVVLDARSLGWSPVGVTTDLFIQATVDASTWKLEVLGPLDVWAQYVDEHGNDASGLASGEYVRVREGVWPRLRVTFATPGGGKVRVIGRTASF